MEQNQIDNKKAFQYDLYLPPVLTVTPSMATKCRSRGV